jgi:predicted nucleic acid-binding protein
MTAESRDFVDTNVPVYAYDTEAGTKHDIAQGVLADLWRSRRGVS